MKRESDAAASAKRFNDQLRELNDSFALQVKSGKVTTDQLERYAETLGDITQGARAAGVTLEASETKQAAALQASAAALIAKAKAAEEARLAALELAKANEIEARTLAAERVEAYAEALSNASDAQLQTSLERERVAERQAKLDVQNAKTSKAAEEAANRYNAARVAAEGIEGELARRYNESATAVKALTAAESDRLERIYGGQGGIDFTIAAVERTEGAFTSVQDGVNKLLNAGVTLTDKLLKELEKRFPDAIKPQALNDLPTTLSNAAEQAAALADAEERLNAIRGIGVQDAYLKF
ncbi:MAG: hypothetical protein ACRDAM_10545, partial [Casimicrobium sp.]